MRRGAQRRLGPLCAVAAATLLAGCELFGLGAIRCHADDNCPSGFSCDAEGFCQRDQPWVPPWVEPGDDAGGEVDSGSSSSCAAASCGTMPDSATAYCSDGHSQGVACPAPGQPFYGQDGNFLAPAPAYATPATGVVQDLVTGLFWEQVPDATERSYGAAVARCQGLGLAGRQWRVPGYRELMSLFDYGRGGEAGQAAMDPIYFPELTVATWTSTPQYADTTWVFDYDGEPLRYSSGDTNAVRCVSGEAELGGALEQRGEDWLDVATGLVWRSQSEGPYSWQQALARCAELDAGGHDDWRLPSAKELETTVDRGRDGWPYIRAPLVVGGCGTYGDCDPYWTSTPEHLSSYAWYLDYDDGAIVTNPVSYSYHARCVRGPVE